MLTSFVVDDCVAVDAGSLGLTDSTEDWSHVRDVLLTHCHIDHIASLPIFVERVRNSCDDTVRVHGPAHTIDALKDDVFNGRLYPDVLSDDGLGSPLVRVAPLDVEKSVSVGNHSVVAVEVDHTVPCYGYLIQSEGRTLVFSGDTRPTARIWELSHSSEGPLLVFLECSFPNRLEELALKTGHLTPRLLAEEVEKIPDHARILVVHIKADFYEDVVSEIQTLRHTRIEIGQPHQEYAV